MDNITSILSTDDTLLNLDFQFMSSTYFLKINLRVRLLQSMKGILTEVEILVQLMTLSVGPPLILT